MPPPSDRLSPRRTVQESRVGCLLPAPEEKDAGWEEGPFARRGTLPGDLVPTGLSFRPRSLVKAGDRREGRTRLRGGRPRPGEQQRHRLPASDNRKQSTVSASRLQRISTCRGARGGTGWHLSPPAASWGPGRLRRLEETQARAGSAPGATGPSEQPTRRSDLVPTGDGIFRGVRRHGSSEKRLCPDHRARAGAAGKTALGAPSTPSGPCFLPGPPTRVYSSYENPGLVPGDIHGVSLRGPRAAGS